MVDTLDSKSGRGDPVSVRVRPQVPRPFFNTFLKLLKTLKTSKNTSFTSNLSLLLILFFFNCFQYKVYTKIYTQIKTYKINSYNIVFTIKIAILFLKLLNPYLLSHLILLKSSFIASLSI